MNVRHGFLVEWPADLDAALDVALERDFDYVELNMDYAFERERVDAASVRRAAAERDVDLLVHLPYRLAAASPHEHVREGAVRELEATIDAAVELGAEKGVFHAVSLAHPAKWDRDEVRARIYESVRRIDEYASERGFTACVENLKTDFHDASDFPELFERTDAVACLDTGHAHVTGQSLTEQADLLREWGERVAHVHVNDTRRDDEDEHLPVGLGKLDFGVLADAIRETDWSGTLTHEVETFDYEYAACGRDRLVRLLDASAD
ncbi:sugar phosphate isomerase/epimerase [Halorussus gelatinilyticus]|uniref:Sugar phosphate isomerase/epimerase n=1 Tax=Halorussus gelatinilyticus TaxID=2937524 RepID=A0A8U0IG81_9EURY|nr:sugar phosphate isomerase/epimerase [Halorussus gelatinilyticus]UPV99283.1 sugar phosphate isomerase/epimerase [Halorussus gelatinilyticus]